MKTRLSELKHGDIFTIVSGARYRFLRTLPNGRGYRVEKIGEAVTFARNHNTNLELLGGVEK